MAGMEGSSINRPPFFNGTGYGFWKIKMKAFVQGIDLDIWEVIETGPHVPKHSVNNVEVNKPRSLWTPEEKTKVQHGLKAKNIIISALGPDEFPRISNCETAKEMWDALEVTHEGTNEVKRSRINTLTREFELFSMQSNESIQEMQKRFTHLVNQLTSLGKKFQNEDLVNKVLRCLDRNWQPKVTAIAESRDLESLNLATLFGKLQEHEMELLRLQQNEDGERKKKSLALKVSSSPPIDEEDDDSDQIEGNEETMAMLAKKFSRFLRRKGNQRRPGFPSKKNFSKGEGSNPQITCYECGKPGHIKFDCPTLKSKGEKPHKKFEKRSSNPNKGRQAYIAWDDNDVSSSEESEEEEANLCLMGMLDNDESDDETIACLMADLENDDLLDEEDEVLESEPNFDELKDAFAELHNDSMKIASKLDHQKKENENLLTEINRLKKEIDCLANPIHVTLPCISCDKLRKEIDDLNAVLAKFTSSTITLDILLGKRRHLNKVGVGYDDDNEPVTFMHKHHNMPSKSKKPSSSKCHYCCKSDHITSMCNVKKFGEAKLKMMWVPKGTIPVTNSKRTQAKWVPKGTP